ncbi:type VI secretion system baseplate subunit TssE [Sphingomonas sp. DT-51]|uniref:type VI secretion system baseplate subunit TssE n=1 Tax=Sphingomonas sp. DT-51 TaxID=3396165 RepID=UPI003F1A0D0E
MTPRIDPTLFDKLIGDSGPESARDDSGRASIAVDGLGYLSVPRVERFNEAGLRSTLLRELGWLLNTTNLAAVQDLSATPEVATSTLNYGLGDLSGTLLTQDGVNARAGDMREAILRYEPRVERGSLEVVPMLEDAKLNSVSFVIRGDITTAVRALPVEIRTDVELETGVASVRDA